MQFKYKLKNLIGVYFFTTLLLINLLFDLLPKESNKTISIFIIIFTVIYFLNLSKQKSKSI
jgi:hypothetical protein